MKMIIPLNSFILYLHVYLPFYYLDSNSSIIEHFTEKEQNRTDKKKNKKNKRK